MKLNRLRAPFRSSDFIECEDETDFVRRKETRLRLLDKIHGNGISAVGGPISRSLLREQINDALIDQLASRELVKRMEELFEGHQFVFRQTKEQLARQITRMQDVVAGFNLSILANAHGESGSAGSEIEIDSAEIGAKNRFETMFNTVKLRAEAFALESLGRHAGAIKIVSKLMAETDGNTDRAKAPQGPKAPKPPDQTVWDAMCAWADELERAMKAEDEKSEQEE